MAAVGLSSGRRAAQPFASAATVADRARGRQRGRRAAPMLTPRALDFRATTGLPPAPDAPPQPGPSAPSGPPQTGWHPARPPLTTPWTTRVSAAGDWRPYPDPQLTRRAWENLNGVWQFAAAGPGRRPPVDRRLRRRILVPFPMESALSGIEAHHSYSWYRRTFTIPRAWHGKHLLLHFGAVDWQASVWVNGRLVGTHRGGYDPFTLDITSALRRRGAQELIVGVYAPVDHGGEPIGKQRLRPGGIFYTPSSGIWQTVWLAPVPASHIDGLDTTTVVSRDTVRVAAQTTAAAGDRLQVVVYAGHRAVARATGPAVGTVSVRIRHARLWSPAHPYLYGLSVRLLRHGRGVDAVGSYFGMRSISIADVGGVAKVVLNSRPLFMLGALDQGYWPDGIYTAPTPQALQSDLLTERALGFNTVRKHMKVEPQLWYYDADRLGMLVWQDMPAMAIAAPSRAAEAEFLRELHAMILTHADHPSIVQWVPFNEGWGEFDPAGVTAAVRGWDPTRPVDTISGYNCCYSFGPDPGDVLDNHTYLGPGVQNPTGSQASQDGELGGLELAVGGHLWPGTPFGYEHEAGSRVLTARYDDLVAQAGLEALHFGLSAGIYTAATDVEDEADGLVTYDRRVVKVDPSAVRAANRAAIAEGSRAPVAFGAYANLDSAYDNIGITDPAAPLAGDLDGGGQSYSAAGLAAAGLAPGGTVSVDGVPVAWPGAAAGQADNVVCGGQTILVERSGGRLVVLGTATGASGAAQTGSGTITYTDGSSQPFQLTFADWTSAGPAAGTQVVASVPSAGGPGSGAPGRVVHLYAEAVALAPGKTVRSITLPEVNDGIVETSRPALHVFAIGVG